MCDTRPLKDEAIKKLKQNLDDLSMKAVETIVNGGNLSNNFRKAPLEKAIAFLISELEWRKESHEENLSESQSREFLMTQNDPSTVQSVTKDSEQTLGPGDSEMPSILLSPSPLSQRQFLDPTNEPTNRSYASVAKGDLPAEENSNQSQSDDTLSITQYQEFFGISEKPSQREKEKKKKTGDTTRMSGVRQDI